MAASGSHSELPNCGVKPKGIEEVNVFVTLEARYKGAPDFEMYVFTPCGFSSGRESASHKITVSKYKKEKPPAQASLRSSTSDFHAKSEIWSTASCY